MITVISHLGDADALGIPDDLRGEVEVVFLRGRDEVPAGLRADALVTFPRGSAVLEPSLAAGPRWVHLTGTGINAFPLERITGDVVLTNSRGASAVPISEWVLTTLLAFEKHVPDVFIHEAPEHWNSSAPLGTLHGRTLALIGFGHIGEAIARRALPFGMSVRALRRSDAPSPLPEVELCRSIGDLLDGAHHVVVAAPLTDETRHLLSTDAFAAMTPGVHLVNIARGEIIDQDALRVALDDGTVACASLDVMTPEPLPAGHWLYTHPQVRLTPHISWMMPGAIEALFEDFVANLRRFLAGEPLANVVDPARGY